MNHHGWEITTVMQISTMLVVSGTMGIVARKRKQHMAGITIASSAILNFANAWIQITMTCLKRPFKIVFIKRDELIKRNN